MSNKKILQNKWKHTLELIYMIITYKNTKIKIIIQKVVYTLLAEYVSHKFWIYLGDSILEINVQFCSKSCRFY